jgi:hypothetical protein
MEEKNGKWDHIMKFHFFKDLLSHLIQLTRSVETEI